MKALAVLATLAAVAAGMVLPHRADAAPRTVRPLGYGRIMALGDSITAQSPGYRSQLQQMMHAQHVWVGSQVDAGGMAHEGRSGWTIDQLAAIARGASAAARPDVVIIDAGTNDAGRDHNDSAAQMLADMHVLLAEVRAGAPGCLIVLIQPTLTPINTDAQRAALNDFGDALPDLRTEIHGITIVDVRGIPMDDSDGVHPGPAGQLAMAQRIFPRIPQRLTH